MSFQRAVLNLALSVFVAPIPLLAVIAYLYPGDGIPVVPSLLAGAISIGLYWFVALAARKHATDPAALPRRNLPTPSRPGETYDERAALGLREPPRPEKDEQCRPHRRNFASSIPAFTPNGRTAERKRRREEVKSFRDIPDPLVRSEADDPMEILGHRIDDLRQLKRLLRDHRVNLLNQWYRNVRNDMFGTRDLSDWAYEADRFLLSTGFAPRTLNRHEAIASLTADIEQIAKNSNQGPDTRKSRNASRSLAFHKRCAITLQRHGWATHVAAEPRSDGIDLFAEYDDVIVGLHCRIYTHPVGEEVLDQLLTAARYYWLDSAAVVSPSGFTGAARAMAISENIALLDREELGQLHSFVRDPQKIVTLSQRRARVL